MNKPYNIQNTNICNGIFHISFFKALLINEGETTQGKQDSGRNDPVPITGYWETGQLGPIFNVKSDHFLGQLGPIFEDNSDHFSRTTRTSIKCKIRSIFSHF